MAPTQHRWRSQIALLQEACARRTPVTVETCRPRRRVTPAALLRVEAERVLLVGSLTLPDEIGTPERVEISFGHEQVWYSFRSDVLSDPPPGEIWAAALPLRITQRPERRRRRIDLPKVMPVTVRMTSMYDRRRTFVGRLRNVSEGGLAVACRNGPPEASQRGTPHWVEFGLPGTHRLFEFAARLAYIQPQPGGEILHGWSFYATDDNAAYLEQLLEIDRLLSGTAAEDGPSMETTA